MNVLKMQIVAGIEKYKKVTDVAAALGMKQPTVSFHMKSLEKEYGTSLFQQRGGRVLLTEAGRALLPYAIKIVALAEEAGRSVKAMSDQQGQGPLPLAAAPVPGGCWLPSAAAAFLRERPEVRLRLSILPEHVLRERLRSREIGLALLTLPPGSPPQGDASLHFRPAGQDEPVLVFPPGHALDRPGDLAAPGLPAGTAAGLAAPAEHPAVTPGQAAALPLWLPEAGSCIRQSADAWAARNGVALMARGEAGSFEALMGLVLADGSPGICSAAAAAAELAAGRLRGIPLPGEPAAACPWGWSWRRDQELTPLQEALMDACGQPNQ
ncbi:LysR family transcriptional regulator [Paenibacillus glufosinatiresistens]|uniref:LysR family transcriptional regulator n=1 Tax=Paenibacillus glufosinatiresistens TaxID=3070657 RepID=UPI00286E45C6|nr:LysR family transcriptional regulator [Paenibacillus sp. YX.27]